MLIQKLRRKPRGGERLSFAAIAARLNAEGAPDAYGQAVGAGNGAADREPAKMTSGERRARKLTANLTAKPNGFGGNSGRGVTANP